MVAELQAKGLNKIIFLSHAGYEKNLEIAEKVSGIDVIITGDTHYLLGESYTEYGLKPVAEYPKKIMSPAGEPVYVAEAWCYSHMVGNMKVKFDDKGVITELKAEPTIVIGDSSFEVKNDKGEKSELQGKEREDIIKYVNSRKDIKFVKEDPTAQKVLEKYKQEKNELGKKEIGNITQEIPGGSENRIPNEKNPEGSLATTLVSETVLHMLKNMGTGNIDMVIMNSGGTRVKKVEVLDAKTNKWIPIDAGKTYTVGTNSYIAAGKDGYTTFGKITSTPGREGVNTHLGVETAFINYVKEKKSVGRPESSNVKFKY